MHDTALCPLCQGPVGELSRCVRCGAAARVGAFEVRALISQRPHSRLYRGVDATGREVAIKELIFTLVPDRETLEAFAREASFLRRLSHPQIPGFVASLEVGEGVHTRLYLVQQFIAGASLAERFESERLTEGAMVRVAAQVLSVLEHLHGRQPVVVHRDVKPSNLIASASGPLYLVDFGTARGLSRSETFRSTLVGTFGYMPFEQLGGTVDVSSDLYALGATLLHGLTGKTPDAMLGDSGQLQVPQSLSLSPARRRFLERLLEPRRSKRFASAADARRALLHPPPRWRSIAARMGAFALSLILVWLMVRRTEPSSVTTRLMRLEAYDRLLWIYNRQRGHYSFHDSYAENLPTLSVEPKDTCWYGSSLAPPRDQNELVTCHFRVRMEKLGPGATGHFIVVATGEAEPALGLTYTITSDGVSRNGIPTLDHVALTNLTDWSALTAFALTLLGR